MTLVRRPSRTAAAHSIPDDAESFPDRFAQIILWVVSVVNTARLNRQALPMSMFFVIVHPNFLDIDLATCS